MDCFTYVMMMIMIALAICSSSLYGLEFTITNGPQDTTVCMNDMAECTCGFDGANPLTTVPDWIIITRNSNGTLISNVTIDGEDIVDNKHDGLMWQVGQTNTTSSPNSKLVVGPVDETHNQSSYQCVFRLNEIVNGSFRRQIVKSSVGTLTVVGPPSIRNIEVNEICATSLSVSWNTHGHPVCGVLSQLVTISSSSYSGQTFNTNYNNFTYDHLNGSTSYVLTVILKYKRNQFISRDTTVKTLTPLAVGHPGVSDLKALQVWNSVIIAWKPPTINHCFTSEFQYYQVIVTTNERNDSSQKKISNVTSNDTIIILSDYVDIQPNQLYTISVSAIYNEDSSPPLVISFTKDAVPNNDDKMDDDINDDDDDDDDQCSSMVIGFIVTIVVSVAITIGISAVMMWCLYKHRREEAVTPKIQQLTADTIEMQSSPAYVPMSQDDIKPSTVPQYETMQHGNDVKMQNNPAYLTHKNT